MVDDGEEEVKDVTPIQIIPPTPTAPRTSTPKVAFAEVPKAPPELIQPTITSMLHARRRGATGSAVPSVKQAKAKSNKSYANKAKSPPKPLNHTTFLHDHRLGTLR